MQENEEKLLLMKGERVSKALMKLGLPAMVGLLVGALFNVVDAFFVSGLGTSQMGAVSVAFPIGQTIIGLGMIFGSGSASYLSRLLGQGKRDKANQVASTALFSSLITGVIVIVLALLFLDELLAFLGATETIMPYARSYATIFIGLSLFSIFNITINHTITSEGASKTTMVAMIVGAVLNVILDPIFIFAFGLGVQGAAIATIISQMVTSLVYLHFILAHKGVLRFSIRKFAPSKQTYLEILKIGIPGFMFQLLVSVSMGLTNVAASAYGDEAVAAMGVSIRIMTVGTYVIFGFMRGFQPIAGYNYGAGLYGRLKEALSLSLKWANIFCVSMGVVVFIFAPQLMMLFSADAMVIDIGVRALHANAIMFVFYGIPIVYAVLFLATGKAKEGSFLSISRQGLFFIPVILVLPFFFGLSGIIWAQPIADMFTLAITAFFCSSTPQGIVCEQTICTNKQKRRDRYHLNG